MKAAEMLREFHDAFDAAITDEWDVERGRAVRSTLLREECAEAIEAFDRYAAAGECRSCRRDALGQVARELADVVYVAYGSALVYGVDLDAALAEVHRSNMSKRGPDGRFDVRDDGKVLKGSDFRPPDMAAALR